MNWTQGTFARYSRRKALDTEAARQREYFSKTQAGHRRSLEASSPDASLSSFVPSYMKKRATGAECPVTHQPQSSPRAPARPSQKWPRLLISDDFTGFQRANTEESSASATETSNDPLHKQPGRSQAQPESDMETKKRKLLENGDWAGIKLQKSLSIEHWKPTDPRKRSMQILGKTSKGRNHIAVAPATESRVMTAQGRYFESFRKFPMKVRIGSDESNDSCEESCIESPIPQRRNFPSILDWQSQRAPTISPEDSSSQRCTSPWESVESNMGLGSTDSTKEISSTGEERSSRTARDVFTERYGMPGISKATARNARQHTGSFHVKQK
jgi:hypothetical protein